MKIFAVFKKEIINLWRDSAGLALLFVMPMIFVLVITLIQDDHFGTQKQNINLLLLGANQTETTQLVDNLSSSQKGVNIVTEIDGKQFTEEQARSLVAKGRYQGLIILPEGTIDAVAKHSKQQLIGDSEGGQELQPVHLIYDANLPEALQHGVTNVLQQQFQAIQMQAITQVTQNLLGVEPKVADPVDLVVTEYAQIGANAMNPNSTQQNVPAWSIFGMFFIVVPIATTFIRERDEWVYYRSLAAPVSQASILLGKSLAYMIINLIQLGLMLLLGVTVLPLLGAPMLSFGDNPSLIILIGIVTAMASAGLGLYLGNILKSYEQASIFSAILIVIFAAIGGIMVPIYMMPEFMQSVAFISPLNWSQHAFITVLVRGGRLINILPDLGLLFGFFILMTGLSVRKMRRIY